MTRTKRKWWQRKTNWAIIAAVASQIALLHPVTAIYSAIILKVAAAAGIYSIADRAGKENEAE